MGPLWRRPPPETQGGHGRGSRNPGLGARWSSPAVLTAFAGPSGAERAGGGSVPHPGAPRRTGPRVLCDGHGTRGRLPSSPMRGTGAASGARSTMNMAETRLPALRRSDDTRTHAATRIPREPATLVRTALHDAAPGTPSARRPSFLQGAGYALVGGGGVSRPDRGRVRPHRRRATRSILGSTAQRGGGGVRASGSAELDPFARSIAKWHNLDGRASGFLDHRRG